MHRSNIKIKDDRLFVGKKLHGSVIDNTFQLVQSERRVQHQQCETDRLCTPIPSLVTTEPRGNVVDNPCIVESNRVTDCLGLSASATVQESTLPANSTSHSSDLSATLDSPTSPSSETTPKPNNS